MENEAEKIFCELKEDVLAYVQLKYRYLKLTAVERTAKGLAALSHGVFLSFFVFFAFLFLFVAFGFFLGELLDSMALGFLIIAGIFLLLMGITVIWKQGIRLKLMNLFIAAMQDKENQVSQVKENDGRE